MGSVSVGTKPLGLVKGSMTGTYTGEMFDGKADGEGCWESSSTVGKRTYVGHFWNDRRHGEGTRTYANGDKYKGGWDYGEKHGHGTYIWADGSMYEGLFEHDQSEGLGSYTHKNGDKYVGEWKNDDENDDCQRTYFFHAFTASGRYLGEYNNKQNRKSKRSQKDARLDALITKTSLSARAFAIASGSNDASPSSARRRRRSSVMTRLLQMRKGKASPRTEPNEQALN